MTASGEKLSLDRFGRLTVFDANHIFVKKDELPPRSENGLCYAKIFFHKIHGGPGGTALLVENQTLNLSSNNNSLQGISKGYKRRCLANWLRSALPGDIARMIFAPRKIIQAADDALTHDDLIFLESLLNGGDLAIVQGYFGKLVIMDEEAFADLAGGLA